MTANEKALELSRRISSLGAGMYVNKRLNVLLSDSLAPVMSRKLHLYLIDNPDVEREIFSLNGCKYPLDDHDDGTLCIVHYISPLWEQDTAYMPAEDIAVRNYWEKVLLWLRDFGFKSPDLWTAIDVASEYQGRHDNNFP